MVIWHASTFLWHHCNALFNIDELQSCPWDPLGSPQRDPDWTSLIARFMGPTWGPSGADRTQVGPMLAPWTLLSGLTSVCSVSLVLIGVEGNCNFITSYKLCPWQWCNIMNSNLMNWHVYIRLGLKVYNELWIICHLWGHLWAGFAIYQRMSHAEVCRFLASGSCFTNDSQALQNNVAEIYNARNNIYAENFKLKLCTCSQSHALGTRTKFQLELP